MCIAENIIDETITAPVLPKKDSCNPLNKNPRNNISSKIGPKITTPKYNKGKLLALL